MGIEDKPQKTENKNEFDIGGSPSNLKRANSAIKKLLADKDNTLDGKIATVRTVQRVNKGQFVSAFKSLMKK